VIKYAIIGLLAFTTTADALTLRQRIAIAKKHGSNERDLKQVQANEDRIMKNLQATVDKRNEQRCAVIKMQGGRC